MAKKPIVIVPKHNSFDESLANDQLNALKNLFPEVMTEVKNDSGQIVYGIDVEKLAEAVNGKAIEKFETYGLNWIGKSQCIALSKEPPAGALRPCIEDSEKFNETENVYIEGDNLEVLKLLRSSYKGKIKMIYIDPPYNTGNDFIYKDNFKMPIKQYKLITGQKDKDGNKLTTEQETAGYKHSDWLNMMYPRLKIARELLTDDGVIFISIDDNEIANLKKICDEIFGGVNIDILIWQKTDPWIDRNTNAKYVSRFLEFKEYIVIAYKNKNIINFNKIMRTPDWKYQQRNIDNDARGNWQSGIFSYQEGHRNEDKTSKSYFEITTPGGKKYKRHWFCNNYDEYMRLLNESVLYFGQDGNSAPRIKIFEEVEKPFYLTSIIRGLGTTSSAKDEIFNIYGSRELFDTPKPSKLIRELIRASSTQDSFILDFFSGSATTAHAVMHLNAEDGGNRKFIMVQLPEETSEKSEAYKAGYKNIYEIGKERIRRAGKKIKEEYPDKNIDTGFRVYKLDSSNINEDIFQKPHEVSINTLTADIIKEDRTDLDLLTQVMLENSIELSMPIKEEEIDGNKVYSVDNDYLIACFDTDIKEETFKKLLQMENVVLIALKKPINDSFLTNVDVLKMQYNPNVEVRVLEHGI